MNGNKRNLTEMLIRNLQPRERAYLVWDTKQKGLAVQVQPTGNKAYKVIYSYRSRPRWYHLADATAIGLSDARKLAMRIMYQVAEGHDPQAERKAARSVGTFEEIADRYVKEYAMKNNKSWNHTHSKLVRPHLIPRWGKLHISDITRADVEAVHTALASRPSLANQVLAAASAIFSWAMRRDIVKANPCLLVDRNEERSRERVLSAAELPLFWNEFAKAGLHGAALKMLLLTGQRPGEVCAMRTEHIVDGWWEMPGAPVPELKWPGTKNGETHRVWLPAPARELLDEVHAEGQVFGVNELDAVMRTICKALGVTDKVTPHDLRRTHGTMITRLGFGRDAMDRIQNHKGRGVTDVYDRHSYATENQKVMEAVARKLMEIISGKKTKAVVLQFG
jgi:integrase